MKSCLLLFLTLLALTAWHSGAALSPSLWTLNPGDNTVTGSAEMPLTLTGTVGDNPAVFLSSPLPLQPGKQYLLRFQAQGNTGSGCIVSGTPNCNRDIRQIGGFWNEYESVMTLPEHPTDGDRMIRLGAWRTGGEISFQNIAVYECVPVPADDHYRLSAQESVRDGIYRFDSAWNVHGSDGRNVVGMYHAPYFNTSVWCFDEASALVHRFELPGVPQSGGQVTVAPCYNPGGMRLEVAASADGSDFQVVGTVSGLEPTTLALPAALFPAEKIFLRLTGQGASTGGRMQIDSLRYEAPLVSADLNVSGGDAGRLLITSPAAAIQVNGAGVAGNLNTLPLSIQAAAPQSISIRGSAFVAGEERNLVQRFELAAGDNPVLVLLPETLNRIEKLTLSIPAYDFTLEYHGNRASTALLREDCTGRLLPVSLPQLSVWQSSNSVKLARECAPPVAVADSLEMQCAANEMESLQLVFRGEGAARNIQLALSELTGPGGRLTPDLFEWFLVDYVPVELATDILGERNWWPDPLPRLAETGFSLSAGAIQPVWLRLRIPAGTPGGIYTGVLRLSVDGESAEVPLTVTVYDFTLPPNSSIRSAFGMSADTLTPYYRNPKEAYERIHRQLMQELSNARISTYGGEFTALDYTVKLPEQAGEPPEVVFNWEKFDTQMRRLFDEYHFNGAVLNVAGIGGGDFHDRIAGTIGGITEEDPRYESVMAAYLGQLDAHLSANGWDKFLYTYAFDEPEPKDYPFLMHEFAKLKKWAPHLRIMLTEQPEPELYGGPDIWCVGTGTYDPARCRERVESGDEIWWYICTQPRAPFAGEFIDHPGTDLRVWLWQSFQYQVSGILIWHTTYMHSPTAYPESQQNPYLDPMSWATGYGMAPGTKSNWGNGDGRFFYPPISLRNGELAEDNDEVVISMRLEILREGIEDYEYLALLQKLLQEKSGQLPEAQQQEFAALLHIPDSISRNLTDYTHDPRPLEAHRAKVARAIETLNRISP